MFTIANIVFTLHEQLIVYRVSVHWLKSSSWSKCLLFPGAGFYLSLQPTICQASQTNKTTIEESKSLLPSSSQPIPAKR